MSVDNKGEFAGFSHKNQEGNGKGYALSQHKDGDTYLNAPSGKAVHFRIDDSDKVVLSKDGKLGIGTTTPQAALSIAGDGKKTVPDGVMHLTKDTILFGGKNQGAKDHNSALITVASHADNSLNIIGMCESQDHHTRKIDLWAEGGATVHGKVGIETTPQAALSIKGDGKEDHPDEAMHITSDSILFGGENNERRPESAQIAAGKYVENSLNIVGMTEEGKGRETRRIDMWAEAGLNVYGGATVHGDIQLEGVVHFNRDNQVWKIITDKNNFHFFKRDNNISHINGLGEYHLGSDLKLKKDIDSLEDTLEKVLALKPCTYRFKTSADDSPKSVGFIAQEVETLFPELVSEHTEDGKATKMLNYDSFGVLAISAIQEQQKTIEKLQEQNQTLEERIAALEKLILK
ncbi:MAG: tail fiber domain-containing protein [Candidatus Electrothrix sp. Rat3]|nr:tail fiber domain-containing protein [Candidatus Electrothrix rattekaaiensis]